MRVKANKRYLSAQWPPDHLFNSFYHEVIPLDTLSDTGNSILAIGISSTASSFLFS